MLQLKPHRRVAMTVRFCSLKAGMDGGNGWEQGNEDGHPLTVQLNYRLG